MILPRKYPPVTRGKIVVWGLLASAPFGGMIWQVFHHLVPLRRLGFDVWYVERCSLLLDLRIVLRTVRVVFGQSGLYFHGKGSAWHSPPVKR